MTPDCSILTGTRRVVPLPEYLKGIPFRTRRHGQYFSHGGNGRPGRVSRRRSRANGRRTFYPTVDPFESGRFDPDNGAVGKALWRLRPS